MSMDASIDVSEESASLGMEAEIPDFYEKEAGAVSFQTDVGGFAKNCGRTDCRKLTATVQKPDPGRYWIASWEIRKSERKMRKITIIGMKE